MKLAVIDLETTATDEHDGSIIEVGAIVLDERNLQPLGSWEAVVRPLAEHRDPGQWPNIIRRMHADSGLLDLIGSDDALRLDLADERLATWLTGFRDSSDEKLALAGSGVGHFDSRWLKRWMPQTSGLLTYWTYDVGVIRRFCRDLCGIPDPHLVEHKPHRALADAWLHAQELIAWRDLLARAHGGRA